MSKALVAYFSASGTTARPAREIAQATGADLYEIVPRSTYSAADLNWNDSSSRTSLERLDEGMRPELARPLPDTAAYDTVFVGFPVKGLNERSADVLVDRLRDFLAAKGANVPVFRVVETGLAMRAIAAGR